MKQEATRAGSWVQSLLAERDALIDAVLDELDRQWEINSGDETSVADYEDYSIGSERLAAVSRRHSEGAVRRALRLARSDADFAAAHNRRAPPTPEALPDIFARRALARVLSDSDLMVLDKRATSASTATTDASPVDLKNTAATNHHDHQQRRQAATSTSSWH